MNKLLATLLATAAGATIAAAPAFAQTSDTAGYRKAMQKIEADHKTAKQKCDALKDEDVCEEQADVMRARAEAAAVAKYDNTPANRDAARRKLAEAEYELAEEKCDTMKGNAKDSCMSTAKSARTAALAETRDGKTTASTSTATRGAAAAATGGLVSTIDTKDPVKAAAVEKCEKQGNKTACLVENKDARNTVATTTATTAAAGSTAAARTEAAAERAGDKARMAASTAAEKTKAAASTVVEKTKQAARTVAEKTGLDGAPDRARAAAAKIADKTERAADTAAARTEMAAENVGDKTRDAAATAAVNADRATDRVGAATTTALADTAITTKVKAGLAAAPDLSSLAIKVETEQGVVMLSGFVESKAEAERAEQVARSVEGVTSVKSAIAVK